MSGSLSAWLTLREPADHAARSEVLTRRIVDSTAPADVVSVLDLAAGTGSNLRFLAGRLQRRQRWLLVDRDASLLAEAVERTATWAAARDCELHRQAAGFVLRGAALECDVETRCVDLGSLDDTGLFAGRGLVTASALLDLVSERWLQTLAMRCRAAGAAALFTITYNGQSSCLPEEAEDDTIRRLMNEHQARDKGLGGPAAGPAAAHLAEECFREAGFLVERERSDWVLEPTGVSDTRGVRLPWVPGRRGRAGQPEEEEFQRQLIEGWAEAAAATAPDLEPVIASWKARRFEHVAAGRSRLIVGHDDLAAWLPRA